MSQAHFRSTRPSEPIPRGERRSESGLPFLKNHPALPVIFCPFKPNKSRFSLLFDLQKPSGSAGYFLPIQTKQK
jgi:hypothetical protein